MDMAALSDGGGPTTARFYSVREAARILGVSAMTVYRSIADGDLPAVRIRNRLIIPASAIDNIGGRANPHTSKETA